MSSRRKTATCDGGFGNCAEIGTWAEISMTSGLTVLFDSCTDDTGRAAALLSAVMRGRIPGREHDMPIVEGAPCPLLNADNSCSVFGTSACRLTVSAPRLAHPPCHSAQERWGA
jgi:hypothetical protein